MTTIKKYKIERIKANRRIRPSIMSADTWIPAQCAFISKNGKRCPFRGVFLRGTHDEKQHFCPEHNAR